MNISGELIPLLLALTSGILMAVQGSINSALSKVIGVLEATFIVHITGTALVIVLLFIFRLGKGNLSVLTTAPWYTFLGGIMGMLIVYLVVASIPQIGVANATTAIIVGQVLTALIIDYFGLFTLTKTSFGINQIAGLVLLAIGAKLLLKLN